ncbi:unnamed protein product [Penicillium camemberti]|uniref:Str. FM013 n=1 Tax=Penicillium camemberti (strain FM 013) TaxID=1429867 RepID=A0A0G4PLH3_PENC3|nr:unnamed protein product [Penicillium camemberti]
MLNGADACASPDHDKFIGKGANAERVNAVQMIALDHSRSFQPDCTSRIHNPPIPSAVLARYPSSLTVTQPH